MSGSFVWVKGMRGPAPQKWPADFPAEKRKHAEILVEYKLSEGQIDLPISDLELLYPAPRMALQ